jgi:transcription antitermination factor NusG
MLMSIDTLYRADPGSDVTTRDLAARTEGLEGLPWFAIRVRSRCEATAYKELSARGLETFLPLQPVRRRWSDRIMMLDLPVFPGYLFCRFELSNRFRVLNTPGVAQIVGAGNTPIPISETEIRSVRTMLAVKIPLVPWPYLRVGQPVHIRRGPLAGIEGIIARAPDGGTRVVVSVDLLKRSVAAEIDRDWIGVVQ